MRTLLIIALSVFISACGGKYNTQVSSPEQPLIPEEKKVVNNPNTYLKIHYPKNRDLERIVEGVNLQNAALQNVIEAAIPGVNIIPIDAGVELRKGISLKAQGIPVADFLEQLTGVSDYHYTMINNTIRISSLQTKQWNIAALATKRSGEAAVGQEIAGAASSGDEGSGSSEGESETGTKQKIVFEDDSWKGLIESAEKIIGANDSSSSGSSALGGVLVPGQSQQTQRAKENAVKPYLVASRTNGMIMAASSPSRIKKLDDWLSKQIENSTVQFYLDVSAFEVTLSDNRGAGIDWDTIKRGTINETTTLQGPSPNLIESSNVFSLGANVVRDDISVNALFRFLQRYGKVSLLTQPNITLTNGKEAYFSSGLEFSYTSSIEQAQDQQGNITVTPQIERAKVGVTISITARLLHDRKIALDVVPVITAIEGFTNIQAGEDFQARTPNIALKELATQVITEPGQPVRLGGLISERIREDAVRVPRDGDKAAFWDYFFKSQINELERRELVISITPTIVES